ncbi:MAG: glucose 1-dehydrogenase [Bryobacteraceae bacterium]|nr:glucose 1-dehydrogenase [Bryobacteraceae bacterium]MDW8379763.1 glucose 1-dehydrogenase [Bryobacterales bacterium]
MRAEFEGKTALVTGASRGIGAATAVTLAREGCSRVLIHYHMHTEGAEQVMREIRAAGAETAGFQSDLSTPSGLGQLRQQLRQLAPEVDILINNAGSLVQRASLAEFTQELFDRVMDLNFRSVWFLSQEVAPAMIRKGWGVIVNLSSIAARHGGGPGAAIYAASKAAVACITKGLAKELAPRGVRVNAVSPGTVDNDFHAKFSTPEMLEAMRKSAPAGRLGDNQEVADLIVFLCSEKARYIIGQTIEINGGMYMV